MKTESVRKMILVSSALLVGIAVCMSVWFFLREHRARTLLAREYPSREQQSLFPTNNGLTTENRKAMQSSPNPDEEPLDRNKKIARDAKSDLMSLLNEEHLANPSVQKLLEVMDSPAYGVYLQDVKKNRPSLRKRLEFLDSQGVPVPWEALAKDFRLQFPTGKPEDYEPEMRLKIAKLFLSAKPVDLANPREAALQRQKVFDEFVEDRRNFSWLHGQFDWEWPGAIRTARPGIESNPAFVWMTDVQQNAASIVAAAEQTKGDALEASAPSWDMSSVMESPPVLPDEMERNRPKIGDLSTDADEQYDTAKRATVAPMVDPEKRVTDALHPLPESPTGTDIETALREQFSSERFERAMSTLERYGPKEGLRRLKENDPEVANQIERHRSKEEISQ